MFKFKNQLKSKKQNGTAAIEFALILPVLIAVVYGGFFFSYVFFMESVLTQAATNGVQAAIAVDPQSKNYATIATAQAKTAVANTIYWLPAKTLAQVSPTVTITGNQPTTIQVQVFFNLKTLFPDILLPILAGTKNIPNTIQGSATGLASVTTNI